MRLLREIIQALIGLPRLAKISIGLAIAVEFIVVTQWERLTSWKTPAPPKAEIAAQSLQPSTAKAQDPPDEVPFASSNYASENPMARLTIEEPLVQPNGTIRGNNRTIYLYGIKPIDSKAVCTRASGDRWACGLNVYATLRNAIAKKTITCDPKAILPKGLAAVCHLGEFDLGLALVRDGMVEADDAVDDDAMMKAQQIAKNKKLGIWDR